MSSSHEHSHHHHEHHMEPEVREVMDHSSHHDSKNMSGSHASHQMSMYFNADTHVTILFSFWTTSSPLAMAWSCAIIMLLGILYEGLKSFREQLMSKENTCSKANGTIASISHPEDHKVENKPRFCIGLKLSMKNSRHLIQTILHGLQVFYSYCLMLIFMTYNIWLCAAVVLGAIIGYFLFSWRRHSCRGCNPKGNFALSEQCH